MIVASVLGSTWAIVGAVVVAIGLLTASWKLIGRGAEGIVLFNKKIVPNVQYMDLLPKLNEILTILEEVVSQVRTNHGSSMMDTQNRLEETTQRLEGYAKENREAAAKAQEAAQIAAQGIADLKVLLGTAKERTTDAAELARDDRDLQRDALKDTKDALREMKKLMDLAAASAALAVESRARTEASGERIEAASAVVAEDLADAKRRADDVHQDEPSGSAADAASQSPDDGE